MAQYGPTAGGSNIARMPMGLPRGDGNQPCPGERLREAELGDRHLMEASLLP